MPRVRMLLAPIAVTLLAIGCLESRAEEKVDLKVGDEAPSFSALDDTGEEWNSKSVVGKKVLVVYFYPADLTGGCTKQACGFRDDLGKLADKDVVVVGVSGDSVRNHQLFKKVHDLTFPLLADTEGKIADAFGVPKRKGGTIEREIDGKTEKLTRAYSASRWTFVIGLDGKIKSKNTKVNAADDSAAVLELFGAN